jgi:cyanophycin synthetase
VIVREDRNPRGRELGETAALVLDGVREAMSAGARAGNAEVVLDEMDATRRALGRSRPGDLVVLCVDHATEVYKELEDRRSLAAPTIFATGGNGQLDSSGGDPDLLGV